MWQGLSNRIVLTWSICLIKLVIFKCIIKKPFKSSLFITLLVSTVGGSSGIFSANFHWQRKSPEEPPDVFSFFIIHPVYIYPNRKFVTLFVPYFPENVLFTVSYSSSLFVVPILALGVLLKHVKNLKM